MTATSSFNQPFLLIDLPLQFYKVSSYGSKQLIIFNFAFRLLFVTRSYIILYEL